MGFTIMLETDEVGAVTPGGTTAAGGTPAAAGTVTVAVPLLEVSTVDVALTVRVAGAWFGPMVKSPLGLIDVPAAPPVTDHVTVWGGLLVPVTWALNCCVEPCGAVIMPGNCHVGNRRGSRCRRGRNRNRCRAASGGVGG